MNPNYLFGLLMQLPANTTITIALRSSPPITTAQFLPQGDVLILQAPARKGPGVERLDVDIADIVGITPLPRAA